MRQMVNQWNAYVKLSAVLMGSHGLTKGSLAFLDYHIQLMTKKRNPTSGPAAKLKERVYTGYTPEQSQVLEEFFCRNPHPDASDREQIGAALALTNDKIKCWFQNRRAVHKRKSEKSLKEELKEKNDILRIANVASKLSLLKATCDSCCMGGSEGNSCSSDIKRLKLENACMMDMIERMNKRLESGTGIRRKHSADAVDDAVPLAEGPSNQGISATEPQFEEIDPDLISDYNEEAHQSLD